MLNKILNFLFKFCIFAVFLLIILIGILKFGIKIENFEISNLSVKNFHLKLENQLVLEIDEIILPKFQNEKKEKNIDDLDDEIKKIAFKIELLKFLFSKVKIKNLKFNEQNFNILYKNQNFIVNSEIFGLSSEILTKNHGFDFKINSLNFKNFNLKITGNFSSNFKSKIFDFSGDFVSHELNGKLIFRLDREILNYEISNVSALSLQKFIDEITKISGLNNEVKSWIFGKIVAKHYFIEFLHGNINLKNSKYYANHMKAKAKVSDLSVKFDENLSEAKADSADIFLENGNLKFNLFNPSYKDNNLSQSSVEIYKIFDENTGIRLDLKTKTPFKDDLSEILKAYGINLPISVMSGNIDAKVLLDINFNTLDVKFQGMADLNNSVIKISDAKFNSNNAKIEFNNDKVEIKEINLKNEIFETNANGKIDLNTLKGEFNAKILKFLLLADKNEILKFSDFNEKLTLDLKNDPILSLKNLATTLKFGKNITIESKNLTQILKFSPLISELKISPSEILLTTPNFENIDILAKNVAFDFNLLNLNNESYKNDDIKLKISKNALVAETGNGNLKFSNDKNGTLIKLKNLAYLIKFDKKNDQNSKIKLKIEAENSKVIFYDFNKSLNFKNLQGSINGDFMSFDALLKTSKVKFQQAENSLILNAQNLSAEELNDFLGKKSFENGKFDLKIKGQNLQNFKGEFLIENSFITDFLGYQKFLSFINSIPALISFKNPDFNDKGFSVKEGKIYFVRKGDILEFEAIDLLGTSADIAGHGNINLATNALNFDIELKYLKDASNIIGKIPLVNQIILGEDRSISTIIKVKGTINEPKYETGVATDLLSTPFHLIKNTIMLPFVIFD